MQWQKALTPTLHLSNGNKVVRVPIVCFLLLFLPLATLAQDGKTISLPVGMRIKVQISRAVISGRVRIGDYIPFKIIETVKVPGGDQVVIKEDTLAIGRVVDRKHKFTIFKKGMVGIAIDSIKADNGTIIPVAIARPNPDKICKDKITKDKLNPNNPQGVVPCVRVRVYEGSFTNILPSAIAAATATAALVLIKDRTAKAAAAVTLAGQVASQPGLSIALNGADAEIDNGEIFDLVVLPPK